MATHVAFLRAINVGGRRVKGADLRAPFEAAGLGQPTTFRASGNVIFEAGSETVDEAGAGDELESRLESALEADLGYGVAVFLRSADQLRAIAAADPFGRAAVKASEGKLQVMLLKREPAAAPHAETLAFATEEDRLHLSGADLFWLPSGGIRDSALDTKAIERLIGPTTTRTMGTVEQIATKHFAG